MMMRFFLSLFFSTLEDKRFYRRSSVFEKKEKKRGKKIRATQKSSLK